MSVGKPVALEEVRAILNKVAADCDYLHFGYGDCTHLPWLNRLRKTYRDLQVPTKPCREICGFS